MEKDSAATRTRILETAAKVFAEHGYAATTVRQICGSAKVNLAAINYHFGGKENLYRETIRYVRRSVYDRYPTTLGMPEDAPADQRLLAFIRSFLYRTSLDERNLGFGTLIMREMVEPTSALDMLVDEGIRTLFGQLTDIVRQILGGDPQRETVLACARSIISQCLFYLFSRSVILRMSPEHDFNPKNLDAIAEQIVQFSLFALAGFRNAAIHQNILA